MEDRIIINIPRAAWLVRETFFYEWEVVKCEIVKFDYADCEIQSVVLRSSRRADHYYPKKYFGDLVFIGNGAESKAKARAVELNERRASHGRKRNCCAP